jgi:hypothetical protein
MSTAYIEITGIAELRQRLSADVLRDALLRGLRIGLRPAAAAVRALAPRRSGKLAASIRATVGNRRGEITGAITSAPYGHLVERGHREVTGGRIQRVGRFTPLSKIGRFRGTVVGQVAPHPFARPAVEAHLGELVAAVESSVKQAIEGHA